MEIKGIKYISPIFDGSGYAQAARGNILALHNAGISLTLHPISFEEAKPDLGKDGQVLRSLVGKDIDYNIVIIHTTPEFWNRFREEGKTNVGYTIWETSKLHPEWEGYINDNVEKVLVGSEWNVGVFKESGVTVPIGVVPHGINVNEFDDIEPYQITGVPEDTYVFYSIFQWVERKHPIPLIKAYWYAFQNVEDNVALVLKVYRSNYSEQEKDAIRISIRKLKQVTPMERHPKIYLLLDMLSNDEMLGLHARGDCYVSLDRGEGFGLCIKNDSIVITSHGMKRIKDIEVNDKIILNGEELNVYKTSSRYINDGNIYKLKIYGNRELMISENHIIPIYNKGDVITKDIEIGDKVYVDKMVFRNECPEFIDILDYVNMDNIEYNETHAWKKMGFSPKTTHSISTIMADLCESKKVVENAIKVYFGEKTMNSSRVNLVVQYLESIQYNRPVLKVNRYVPIDNLFCKMLGYYIAEGDNNGGKGINFSFHTKEIDYHKEVSVSMKYLFGLKPISRFRNNKAEIWCSSSIVAELFGNLCGIHSRNKIIPDLIFNGTADMIKECLLGYFNGDGCYTTWHEISSTTTSEILHYQIMYLLSGFNIYSRMNVRETNNSFILTVNGLDRIKLANLFSIRCFISANMYKEKPIEDLGNCWAVPIIDKCKIDDDSLFCDIAIEGKHYFNANGIIIHNSPFTAGAAGNPIIITGFGGATEYAKKHNSYLINYTLTPVHGMSWSPWYRGDQLWAEPDALNGAELMRKAYANQKETKQMGQILQKDIREKFSWEVIGNKIIKELEKL